MRRSISTTSGRNSAARRTPIRPPEACATTSMSGWDPSSVARPVRNRSWSSTTRTRIEPICCSPSLMIPKSTTFAPREVKLGRAAWCGRSVSGEYIDACVQPLERCMGDDALFRQRLPAGITRAVRTTYKGQILETLGACAPARGRRRALRRAGATARRKSNRSCSEAFSRLLGSSAFTLGTEVELFEEEFAEYCGSAALRGGSVGDRRAVADAPGVRDRPRRRGRRPRAHVHRLGPRGRARRRDAGAVRRGRRTGLIDPDAARAAVWPADGCDPGRSSLRPDVRHGRARGIRQAARPADARGRRAGARSALRGPSGRLAR